jgi:hypothetical protein
MKKSIFILAFLPVLVFGQVNIGLKKLNVKGVVFQYTDPRHKDDLNKTRKSHGSNPVVETKRLDSLALLRCLRIAKLIQESKDCYIPDSVYFKLAHRDLYTPENFSIGDMGAGIKAERFQDLDSAAVLKLVASKIESFRAGPIYDGSEGHLENRISKKHKKFGTATVILFVYGINPYYVESSDKEGLIKYVPRRIYINYELFE